MPSSNETVYYLSDLPLQLLTLDEYHHDELSFRLFCYQLVTILVKTGKMAKIYLTFLANMSKTNKQTNKQTNKNSSTRKYPQSAIVAESKV